MFDVLVAVLIWVFIVIAVSLAIDYGEFSQRVDIERSCSDFGAFKIKDKMYECKLK